MNTSSPVPVGRNDPLYKTLLLVDSRQQDDKPEEGTRYFKRPASLKMFSQTRKVSEEMILHLSKWDEGNNHKGNCILKSVKLRENKFPYCNADFKIMLRHI